MTAYRLIVFAIGMIFAGFMGCSTIPKQIIPKQNAPEPVVYVPVIPSETNSGSGYQLIKAFQAHSPEISQLIEKYKYPSWLGTRNQNNECTLIYFNGIVFKLKNSKLMAPRDATVYEILNTFYKDKTCFVLMDDTLSFEEAKKKAGLLGCILESSKSRIVGVLNYSIGMPDSIVIIKENNIALYGIGYSARGKVFLTDGTKRYIKEWDQIANCFSNKEEFIKYANENKLKQEEAVKIEKMEKEKTTKVAEEAARQAKIKMDKDYATAIQRAGQHKGSTLVFKGFYIGMPTEDARIICSKYGVSPKLNAGDGKLTKLTLNAEEIKKVFGINKIVPLEFVDRFASAYNTPSPNYSPGEAKGTQLGTAVGFKSSDRWKITDGKSYEIIFVESSMTVSYEGITQTKKEFTLNFRRMAGSFD